MTLSLTFSVWSEQYSPDQITAQFGISPDRVAIRGLDRVPARAVPGKHGWHLTAETEQDLPAENVLVQLLARAGTSRDALKRLREGDPELEVRVVIYFDHERSDTSLNLSPTTIADLAELGARLFVSQVDLSIGLH